MQNKRYVIMYFVLAFIPLIYLSTIYKILPDVIPATFGFDGQPIKFGNKSSLIFISSISLIFAYIASYISQIAYRKSKNSRNISILLNIQILAIIFIDVIIIQYNFAVEKFIEDKTNNYALIVFATILIFFVPLGLAIGKIEPNNYIGIKTPYTLKDEKNWRYTHRFTQCFWIVGGIVFTILFVIHPTTLVFIFSVILLTVVPHLFSVCIHNTNSKVK